MIAFSVMVIDSGHTCRQHVVMLQYPMLCLFFRSADAILRIERMHFERRGVDQKARADELLVLVMLAQNVAHVLAQEALDALAEFLHAVHVHLLHAPRAVRRVGRARLETS